MSDDSSPPLNLSEVRVLGALIEKEITTPDYYPLTLNALTLACNQTSNRDPVMSLDEGAVVRALDSLRDRRLAILFKGADSRVPKYSHQFAVNDSDLGRPEVAVMCVLMLRGPQTVGEIRGRTGRLHEFATLDEVEAVLAFLANRPVGALVMKLPRQAGYKEQRYAHLLAGEPAPLPAAESEGRLEPATVAVRAENERVAKLELETAALRAEVEELKRQLADFRRQFE